MKNKIIIIAIFSLALFLRLYVIILAHHGDLNNNISWGTIAYEKGLNGFYEGKELTLNAEGKPNWPFSAPNQPPLTILLFAFTRLIWQAVRNFIWYMNWQLLVFPSKLVWFWDDYGMDILAKLPSIIADLGIGLLIYKFFAERNERKTGVILLLVWLFNPVTWYSSSLWGQTDSIVNFLGLISILALIKKQLIKFASFFAASLIFKGSLSIFIPVLLYLAIKQKHTFKEWLSGFLFAVVIIFLSSIWFHPNLDLFYWLIKLYRDRILPGEIGTLSANAFNFWWLINSSQPNPEITKFGTPDNISYGLMFLRLSARIWGFLITFTGIGFLIGWLSKKITVKRIFFVLQLSALISFLFMTRMHERYLYPFFPVSTVFIGLLPGYWPFYAILSLTGTLNMYYLFWAPSMPLLESFLKTGYWFPNLLAALNIIVFVASLRLLKSAKL